MPTNEPSLRKKGFKPAKRTCLKCGKLFDSLDPTDRFCPKHKIAKYFKERYHQLEEDFGAGFVE